MIHFLKYNLIGLLNTLLTVVVVWVLHQWLGMGVVLANFLGYVAGGLNSYLWNRCWNFRSDNKRGPEMLRFGVIFALAYGLNLGVLLGTGHLLAMPWAQPLLAFCHPYAKPGFLAHLVANAVYVVASFGMYKNWVFKRVQNAKCKV